jgi:transcriptional regulator with XRE-family HTH domain
MASAASSPFGDLLKRYRAAAGLTQDELAERAQLSARTISDLERGVKHRPHAYRVAFYESQKKSRRLGKFAIVIAVACILLLLLLVFVGH